MKPRRTRAVLLAAAILGAAASCARDPAPLRVMTYNIHYGDPDLARIADVICASGADVVGLQEVDVHWSDRSGFADEAAVIASTCGMEARFGPIYTLPPLQEGAPPRRFGVAILSRLPIRAAQNHDLTRLSTQTEGSPEPMPGFLQVTVDVDGTEVDVFSTHLDFRPDPAVRRAQVAEMLTILGDTARPIVLMGDMNATPDHEELAPLFEKLRDAWRSGGDPGFTFPSDEPVRRIDYVFFAGPLAVASARVLDTTASDHRPVVADMILALH
jgi:endonuclease/exonuclease/phosphatase family metal-dependent hydrolase